MADFLREIIDNKKFRDQLAIFSSIEWQLSPLDEELSVNKESLTPEQRTVLDALAEENYVSPASKHSDEYRLRPPTDNDTELNALWMAAFPAAEERLNATLAPFVNLPWHCTDTQEDNYFLRESELNPDQKALLASAPKWTIKNEGMPIPLLVLSGYDTIHYLTSDVRHHNHNRLHTLVHNNMIGGIEHDKSILATLPWEFDSKGNLVLDTGMLPDEFTVTVEGAQKALPMQTSNRTGTEITLHSGKSEVEDIFRRRSVQSQGSQYILRLPNTVRKGWDTPDGDTDTARVEFYEEIHDTVLKRNEPIIELPWRFDEKRWAFVVSDNDLTASGRKGAVEGELARLGTEYEVHDLKTYVGRAYGPKAQMEEFLTKLEAAVPDDINIADLAELPWKHTYDGLRVPGEVLMKSEFAKAWEAIPGDALARPANSSDLIPFKILDTSDVILHRNDAAELPYYARVVREMEKRSRACPQLTKF